MVHILSSSLTLFEGGLFFEGASFLRGTSTTIFRLFAVSAQSQIFSPQVPYGHFSRARLEDGTQYPRDEYHPYQLYHIY
jgi:hypothetical protein